MTTAITVRFNALGYELLHNYCLAFFCNVRKELWASRKFIVPVLLVGVFNAYCDVCFKVYVLYAVSKSSTVQLLASWLSKNPLVYSSITFYKKAVELRASR